MSIRITRSVGIVKPRVASRAPMSFLDLRFGKRRLAIHQVCAAILMQKLLSSFFSPIIIVSVASVKCILQCTHKSIRKSKVFC